MPTQAIHVWRPGHARLVVLDAFVPMVRGGAPSLPEKLVWPVKDPGDVLDYQCDASAVLLGHDGDSIATLDVTLAPVETGGLVLVSAVADGARALLWLSGGLAGRTYTVTIAMTAESGRAIVRDVLLPVRWLSSPPAGAPLLAGDAPITDQNGCPITVS
jgi:hypothetical protein